MHIDTLNPNDPTCKQLAIQMKNQIEKLKEALREIIAQTDGRNHSHIGQDRAHAIALQTIREIERAESNE